MGATKVNRGCNTNHFPSYSYYLSAVTPKVKRLVYVENGQILAAINESFESYRNYKTERSISSFSDVTKF